MSPTRCLILGGALVASIWVAHSPGLHGQFVFDDLPEIVESGRIEQPISVRDFATLRGIGYVSLKLNYLLGGKQPYGYHVVNLAIHILAAFGVWSFLREMIVHRPSVWPSALVRHGELCCWAIALLWGLHPITTQAVAYTIQRFESLWSLAFLVGLTAYLRADRSCSRRTLRWLLGLSIVSFWIGMSCKEPIVLALLALPIYERLFNGLTWQEWFRRRGVYYAFLILPLIIALPTIVIPSLMTADKTASGGFLTQVVTPTEYWRTQPEVVLLYVSKILLPIGQCFDYGWPPQTRLAVSLGCAAIILVALVASIRGWVRREAWSFFPLMFFLCIATTCLVPLIDIAVEHRVYLASAWAIAGLVMLSVTATESCARRVSAFGYDEKWWSRAAVLSIAIILATLTYRRSSVYQSALGLWQDTAEKASWNYRAHSNVASELLKLDRAVEAVDACELAIATKTFGLQPDYQRAKLYDQLASALSAIDDVEGAIQASEKAVSLTPGGSDHLLRLASVYSEHSLWTEAEVALCRAIANRPRRAVLYEHLATVHLQTRSWQAAKSALLRAAELGPTNSASIQRRMAQIEWMLGDRSSASQYFSQLNQGSTTQHSLLELADWLVAAQRFDESREALRIAGVELSAATGSDRRRYQELFMTGDYESAASLVDSAVQTADSETERRYWLIESAVVQSRLGNGDTSLAQLQKLQASIPNDARVWVALGNVQRWLGQTPEAIVSYTHAVQLNDADSDVFNNLGALISPQDPIKAESYLRRALQINAANYQAWHSLGNTLVRQSRLDEAKSCYQRAISINPNFNASIETLAKLQSINTAQ